MVADYSDRYGVGAWGGCDMYQKWMEFTFNRDRDFNLSWDGAWILSLYVGHSRC